MKSNSYSLFASDIPYLLDLALSVKDFKWVKELAEAKHLMYVNHIDEMKRYY